jgi:hypothetical protein
VNHPAAGSSAGDVKRNAPEPSGLGRASPQDY